uniref:Uncharacterized protein n=1 Tax=Zooxanthella nutricula TaxID=1333877 RepID=A0A7S2M0E0_9DINO
MCHVAGGAQGCNGAAAAALVLTSAWAVTLALQRAASMIRSVLVRLVCSALSILAARAPASRAHLDAAAPQGPPPLAASAPLGPAWSEQSSRAKSSSSDASFFGASLNVNGVLAIFCAKEVTRLRKALREDFGGLLSIVAMLKLDLWSPPPSENCMRHYRMLRKVYDAFTQGAHSPEYCVSRGWCTQPS